MSLGNLYEITRRSFRVLDAAMNVAGQNIANADSAGYARRRLTTRADSYGTLGYNARLPAQTPTGTGVSLQSFRRLRDEMLATSANRTNGQLEYSAERQRILSSIEGIIDPSESGLSDRLSEFWNAWSDVADNPTDTSIRSTLLSKAGALTTALNGADRQLQQMESDLRNEIVGQVDRVNELLDRIASLNQTITKSTNAGTPDFAAADERDNLVRELSGLVGIEVQSNHADGLYIAIGGVFVVQGEHSVGLELNVNKLSITFEGSDTRFDPATGGQLGASIRTVTSDMASIRQRLDDVAAAIVNEVNALHTTGYGLDDSTGLSFFDPTGTTASSISISADVLANPERIAVSAAAGAVGNSDIAREIANLRLEKLISGRTLEEDVVDIVGGLGAEISRAATDAGGYASVLNHLDGMEAGVSAVSVEEEMTRIIELQQAYAATARVLRATETMMETLLAI